MTTNNDAREISKHEKVLVDFADECDVMSKETTNGMESIHSLYVARRDAARAGADAIRDLAERDAEIERLTKERDEARKFGEDAARARGSE